MNSIYMFEILNIRENKLILRVETHQSTREYLPKKNPSNKNFVLQLLADFYERCKMGHLYNTNGERPILSKSELQKLAFAAPCAKLWEYYLACMYGKEIPISQLQYQEYQQSVEAFEQKYGVKTSGARASNKGLYYYYTAIDEAAIWQAAEVQIQAVDMLKRAPKRKAYPPFNWVEIECTLASPALLAHLVVGAKWASEIYPLKELAYPQNVA